MEDQAKFDQMLGEPPIIRRAARVQPIRRQQVQTVEAEEGAAFMAFMGEHQQFAATHRGA